MWRGKGGVRDEVEKIGKREKKVSWKEFKE